jgi:hypothetical protein
MIKKINVVTKYSSLAAWPRHHIKQVVVFIVEVEFLMTKKGASSPASDHVWLRDSACRAIVCLNYNFLAQEWAA